MAYLLRTRKGYQTREMICMGFLGCFVTASILRTKRQAEITPPDRKADRTERIKGIQQMQEDLTMLKSTENAIDGNGCTPVSPSKG